MAMGLGEKLQLPMVTDDLKAVSGRIAAGEKQRDQR